MTSSWGNGRAALWRSLIRKLVARGLGVTFFERDAPYFASHRDLHEPSGATLVRCRDRDEVREEARRAVAEADVALVTSCPDGIAATRAADERCAFSFSARLTLNITLTAMGWCPSGRLFEAACCGAPRNSSPDRGLPALMRDRGD